MPTWVRLTLQGIAAGAVLLAVYVGATWLAHSYQTQIEHFVTAGGAGGIIAFILLTAIFLVFLIPLDVSVLIPVAIAAWGPLPTAFMSVAGWTLGSAIAFYLARHYGISYVRWIAGEERVRQAEHAVPHTHLFWWVLLMQAFLTVDFISYVFGLFTPISMGSYLTATALGDLVPAFFFAYVGSLPIWYEIGALLVSIAIAGFFLWRYRAHVLR